MSSAGVRPARVEPPPARPYAIAPGQPVLAAAPEEDRRSRGSRPEPARFVDGWPRQVGDDDVAAGADGVPQDAEDFGVEGGERAPAGDRDGRAGHPRRDLRQGAGWPGTRPGSPTLRRTRGRLPTPQLRSPEPGGRRPPVVRAFRSFLRSPSGDAGPHRRVCWKDSACAFRRPIPRVPGISWTNGWVFEQTVPGVRFELTRPCGQRVLSPPRLPFRHPGAREFRSSSSPVVTDRARTSRVRRPAGRGSRR